MASSTATPCSQPTSPAPGRRPAAPAALALALCLAAPARSAAAAPCPESNLDECTRFTHIMAGMNSGDIGTQLESVHAASQDLDPTLRALVIDDALKSPNQRLRTAGVRYVLKAHPTLDVLIEPPIHPTPEQQKLYQSNANLVLHGIKVDDGSDEISAGLPGALGAHGAMISGGFELSWGHCRLHMTAGEENTLRGALSCSGRDGPVELAASIELT